MRKIVYTIQLLLLVVTGISSNTFATDYYWVGGTGNWSDYQNHWVTTSGGNTFHIQVPQSTDNVFFDANSFSSSGQTVTVDKTIVNCADMNWSGATNTPVFTSSSAANELHIYGSLTFISQMSMSFSGSVYFESTVTGRTVTSAGQSFKSYVYFQGTGGWTLSDDFTVASQSLYLNSGTLNTGNKTVTVSYAFRSTGTNTRTLILGSSVINTGGAATQDNAWSVNHTNLTFNAGTSVINLTGLNNIFSVSGGVTPVYYNLNFTDPASGLIAQLNSSTCQFNNANFSGSGTISGNNTFNNLTFSPGKTYELQTGKTQTITGGLNATGNCNSMINIRSNNIGVQSTFSKTSGTITTDYASLKDISATGGATFTANHAVDLGNNTGWTINTVATQNLYWVGGSGSWDDQTHWSFTSGGAGGACLPTPYDNVFFDSNSGFIPSAKTVTINTDATCKNMDWRGAVNTPVFAGTSPKTLSIYGSLWFIPDMNLTFNGNTYFKAEASGQTITSAGQSFKNYVYFRGEGGWILLDNFSVASQSIYLDKGALNTNSKTVTVSNSFNSNGTNTRSLILGASVINAGEVATQDNAWIVNHTNLVFDAGTSTINLTGLNNIFTLNGTAPPTYYNLNFTNPLSGLTAQIKDVSGIFNEVSFKGSGTISGNNTFNNLSFSDGKTYELQTGKTQTITGGLNAAGNCNSMINIRSDNAGTQATISKVSAAITVDYTSLKDINATGGAVFTANNAADLGNNSGWLFNAGGTKNLYWIGNGGNWSDGSHWSTSSGGAPYGCSPSSADNVFFDINSFSSGGQSVTIDLATASCRNMSWTGVTNMPVLSGTTPNELSIYGSLLFSPGMSITFSGVVNFTATAAGQTITSAGQTFNGNIVFNGIGGGWILQDAFKTGNFSSITLTNGNLNTNSKSVTANVFSSANQNVRTLTLGSSVVTVGINQLQDISWRVDHTNLTFDAGTSTINNIGNRNLFSISGTTPIYYYDLNFTYPTSGTGYGFYRDIDASFHDVSFSGDGTIKGNNTFHNLTFTPGKTYELQSGRTQTILNDLDIAGTAGFPVRIQSMTSGSPATFSKSSGMVCADFIRLSDNTATGGATFYAGANSEDMGGNTGWLFSAGSGGAASVTISSTPPGAICSGTEVQFTADAVNGGSSPAYQWKKNGVDVGNTATYNDNTLANNDVIKCEMTSNSSCVSGSVTVADSVTIQITPGGTAGNITSARDTICSGTPGILTLTGNSGDIQWQSSTNQTDYTDISGASNNNYSDMPTQTTYYRVISGSGSCADTSSVFELVVNPSPVAGFSYVVSGKQVSFTDNSIDATVHEWDFADGATSNDINPTHTYTADGTYHVCLTVYNGSNCSFTNCQDIIAGVTGITEVTKEDYFEIYPNPVSGVLTIKGENNKDIRSIGLYDVLGRLVLDKHFSKTQSGATEINTAGLAEGIYYLRIQTKETNYTQSILKL